MKNERYDESRKVESQRQIRSHHLSSSAPRSRLSVALRPTLLLFSAIRCRMSGRRTDRTPLISCSARSLDRSLTADADIIIFQSVMFTYVIHPNSDVTKDERHRLRFACICDAPQRTRAGLKLKKLAMHARRWLKLHRPFVTSL